MKRNIGKTINSQNFEEVLLKILTKKEFPYTLQEIDIILSNRMKNDLFDRINLVSKKLSFEFDEEVLIFKKLR